MRDALVATLQELVRTSGRDAVASLDYCLDRLLRAGLTDVERVENSGRPAAIARRPGTERPLVLSGHVDVVPAHEGWTVPPHEGRVVGDRVVGRGTSDMLASVAAYLHLAEERPELPLAVALTTDEETGMDGADALVDRAGALLSASRGIVVGEPTDFEVGVAEKGVLWVRLVARGRNAHGSMPHEGVNAAEKLIAAWGRVSALPVDGEHALLGRPTRSLDVVRAGTAVNVVPDRAEAEIDYRYLPGVDADDLLASIREAAAPDADVEVVSLHPPFAVEPAHPLARAAERAVHSVKGGARVVGLPYGTEACKFAPLAPCVILGPGERAAAHTPDESVRVDDLVAGYHVLARLAESLGE